MSIVYFIAHLVDWVGSRSCGPELAYKPSQLDNINDSQRQQIPATTSITPITGKYCSNIYASHD